MSKFDTAFGIKNNSISVGGFVVINAGTFTQAFSTKEINMSGLSTGIYIVRITSSTDVRTYNILKE